MNERLDGRLVVNVLLQKADLVDIGSEQIKKQREPVPAPAAFSSRYLTQGDRLSGLLACCRKEYEVIFSSKNGKFS